MNAKRLCGSALALLLTIGCSEPDPIELPGTSSVRDPHSWRYARELTFVSVEDDAPQAVPFAFRTDPAGESHHSREARAWLARGETWDRFVDELWATPEAAGVWRVLPRRDLRIGAGPAGGIEWLAFRSGDRRLRVEVADDDDRWYGADRERFRVLPGTLTLGAEELSGYVVEEMQVSRYPGQGSAEIAHDRLILLDSNGVALYLLHERGNGEPGATWALAAGTDQASQDGTVEWVQVRTLEEARRDIPLHWSFAAPEVGVTGEVTALGYDAVLGDGRGGRRDVEVRYTVEGWIERDGRRVEVFGVARHLQN